MSYTCAKLSLLAPFSPQIMACVAVQFNPEDGSNMVLRNVGTHGVTIQTKIIWTHYNENLTYYEMSPRISDLAVSCEKCIELS
jgi:hypothetical protein